MLDGKPVTLELVRNPAEGILPEVAEQLARILAEVLDGGAHVLREPLDSSGPTSTKARRRPPTRASPDLRSPSSTRSKVPGPPLSAGDHLEGRVRLATKKKKRKEDGGAGSLIFLAVLPGVAVYALFLVADNGDARRADRRNAGHDEAQLAGPIGTGTLLAGKALYSGALALGALAIFSGVAAVFLRTRPLGPGLPRALAGADPGGRRHVGPGLRPRRHGAEGRDLRLRHLPGDGLPGRELRQRRQPAHDDADDRALHALLLGHPGYRTLLEKGGGLTDVLPGIAVLSVLGVVLLLAGTFFLRRTVARGGAAA